jgi:hypothetical protein
MMDGVPIPRPTTPSSNSLELVGSTFILNASLNSRLLNVCGERMMIKVKMLHIQSKSIATMASHYPSTFEIRDAFMVGKVEINNEWKKKIKINNLKVSRDLNKIWTCN